MKSNTRYVLVPFVAGAAMCAWLFLFAAGCDLASRYRYPAIQAEYADSVGGMRQMEAAAPQAQAGPDVRRAPALPLQVTDAIRLALANNPDQRMAFARILQARAAILLARAAFWPEVTLYTEYLQGDAPSAFLFKTIDQRLLPQRFSFNDPGWFENFESGATARVNLFNGGRDWLEKEMAEAGLVMSRLGQEALENALVVQTIDAFYTALAARQFTRIAAESVATVAEQLRVMRVRFEGGGALKSDILSLEVRLAEAEEALVQSRNRYQTALAGLAALLGAPPELLTGREEAVLRETDFEAPAIPPAYAAGLVYALANRPELASAREAVVRSRLALDQARAGYLPTLDLMGKYYVDDPHMDYNLDRENWTASLMLSWNVFNGFATRARVEAAAASLEEVLAADHKAGLDVKTDVKTAYLNLEAAEARHRVAEQSVASARESFDLVRKQYQGGSVPITRYLEAELDLNRSRIRAAAAYYARIKAQADAARAIGYWAVNAPWEAPGH